MKSFSCSTRILSGYGAVSALGEMGIEKLLLVTDPYFAKNGEADRICALAKAKQTEIFSRITPDPSVALAAEGTAVVRTFQPDTVVALGGGSTLDCAKAMVYFSGQSIRFVAVPTTSGSGSEVTDFAVLTHEGGKHPLVDSKLQPQVAILDGALLEGLPAGLVADTGFDALSHGLEALVATGAGEISDTLAIGGFSAVFAALPRSFAGDKSCRLGIAQGATMTAMAFSQAGLGVCHALSHALGGQFHIPHGRLNAILLPAVIRLNAQKCQEKYARLARLCGIGGSSDTLAVRGLERGLLRLRRELGLPGTLAQAGVSPEVLRKHTGHITEMTLRDPCCRTNPLLVEEFMVKKLLEEVAGRA